MRELTPERLGQFLSEFRAGYIANLTRAIDAIEERDDVLAVVVPKAKASVCRHDWEILTIETQDEQEQRLAERQKEVLERFYNLQWGRGCVAPETVCSHPPQSQQVSRPFARGCRPYRPSAAPQKQDRCLVPGMQALSARERLPRIARHRGARAIRCQMSKNGAAKLSKRNRARQDAYKARPRR
ncbi:MAG: hypothetical protein J7L71_06615 [Spirochaetaceae bacterium]|nr:hypothetical protein [Spirochaetaceae bacterium]